MNRSLLSALAVVIMLAAWMLSGGEKSANAAHTKEREKASQPTQETLTPMRVSTRHSQAEEISRFVRVKGQVEPLRSVTVRAETPGRIIKLPIQKGGRVQAGAVIGKLSLDDRPARRKEAEAAVRQHRRDVKATRRLHKKKLQPESTLRAEESKLARAEARLEQIRWEIGRTVIRTPFAGVLNERPAELGAFLQKGDAVATLVDDASLLLTAQAPQLATLKLSKGQSVRATLIDGTELTGKLSYISTTADRETRSYRIEAVVDNPGHRPLTGLSATLTLPVGTEMAHKISPSSLSLAADGRLIVKGVDAEQRVVTYPVEILRRERQQMWISGPPASFDLITLGQAYLSTGEKVEPVSESDLAHKPGVSADLHRVDG